MTEELSTRDRIIHATAELMELYGYHGTGLNDIVKRSGAPKGSIYHYFPDGKEEIAIETIEMTNAMINHHIQSTLAAYDNPAEGIRQTIRMVIDHFEMHQCKQSGMPSPIEMASVSDNLRQTFERGLEQRRLIFQQKLTASGISHDYAHQLSWLIISLTMGGIMACRVYENTQALALTADQLYDLIQAALPR